MTSALEVAGELAAKAAELAWSADIIDPPKGSHDPRAVASLAFINRVIDENGWGANVTYVGNGPPQWCGMFAGHCWRAGGLDPTWLPSYFASTSRLHLWGNYQRFSPTSKANPPPKTMGHPDEHRLSVFLSPGKTVDYQPRRGDIIIVGDGDPQAGDHVTVVVGFDEAGRMFDTISGNGGGVGPHGGAPREGVSRATYSIDATRGRRAMFAYRPALGDLLAERR